MARRTRTGHRRRNRRQAAAVAGCLLAAALAAPGAVAGPDQEPAPAPAGEPVRLIVELDQPSSAAAEADVAADAGGAHAGRSKPGTFVVEAAGADAVQRLQADERVARVERDVRFVAAETGAPVAVVPNERCFSGCQLAADGTNPQEFSQREMYTVGAPQAWGVTKGSSDVVVAVIDSDINSSHPDLIDKVIEGPNYSGDSEPDNEGHGTAVASLIAAQPDNGAGIAGLGWKTKVLAIRVLDRRGNGFASSIARAIEYAADAPGVRVINLSLQQSEEDGDVVSGELRRAIVYAQERGVLIVAAAGNHGLTSVQYPANFPGVLSVNAVDHNDEMASFSNRGTWVDVSAPGVGILSLSPSLEEGGERFSIHQGTSFSAPLVSAAAALVMAHDPGLTGDEVAMRLQETADAISSTGTDVKYGRINVAKAVSVAPRPRPAGPGPTSNGGGGPGGPPPATGGTLTTPHPATAAPGYRMTGTDGGIFNFGAARYLGSTGDVMLNRPIVGMGQNPVGEGYWLVASDGGIFSFGDARFHGSTGSLNLNRPIVGMAPTPSGRGYWLVASDGGIFSFGDARFHGSTGSVRLNRPIVGMAPTPSGQGYWLVASDGGVFAFGDARFHGSTGSLSLARPIVGMAASPTGAGYWMVASDGGIFAFGDAAFRGTVAQLGRTDVVGMAPTASGQGYWLAAADGTVWPFGDAPELGDLRGTRLNRPIVGFAAG